MRARGASLGPLSCASPLVVAPACESSTQEGKDGEMRNSGHLKASLGSVRLHLKASVWSTLASHSAGAEGQWGFGNAAREPHREGNLSMLG